MQIGVARTRFPTGATLATVLLAGLLGLVACLPVRVGDPEKSRVDARLNGAWLTDEPDTVLFFRPWDARTWMVTVAEVSRDEAACHARALAGEAVLAGDAPAGAAGGAPPPAGEETFGSYERSRARACNAGIYKGWLTTLGGRTFLVLEPAAVLPPATPRAEGYPFDDFRWWVYRIDWPDADRLQLRGVDAEFGGLDKTLSSAEAERIIGENADNPALYGEEPATGGGKNAAEEPMVLQRAPVEVDANIQRLLWSFMGD